MADGNDSCYYFSQLRFEAWLIRGPWNAKFAATFLNKLYLMPRDSLFQDTFLKLQLRQELLLRR